MVERDEREVKLVLDVNRANSPIATCRHSLLRLTYNRFGNPKQFVASASTEYARRYVEGCRMNRTGVAKSFAIPAVVVLASLTLMSTGSARTPEPVPGTGPVPKANCGPGDRTEGGMQGETTRQERLSGD